MADMIALAYAPATASVRRWLRPRLPHTLLGMLPLGIMDEQTYGQATIKLEKGDLLLLYTDGITEASTTPKADAARQLFGTERLDALLLDCGGTSAEGCISRVRKEVAAFSENAPPTDDQTLIAIRCV